MARGAAHWTVVGLSAASVIGLASLRRLTTPAPAGHGTHEQFGLPPCWTMDVLQVPCPGCGVTTAASQLVRGDFAGALATQPFGVLLAVLAVLGLAWSAWTVVSGRDAWDDLRRVSRPWLFWSLAGALVAAWIYKIAALRA
jgi:hypothetical protein